MILKKIDRYILRHFFSALSIVVVSFGLIFIIINLIEELRDFIDHKVPILMILEYYFYFAGWIIKSFLPMFVLLSGLFSVSILARKNEILAMKATGLSLYRIALPLIVAVLFLSAGHFYYNEYVYPPWNKKRLEIKNFSIENKSRKSYTNIDDIYRQIRPGYFYTLETFNTERQEGIDFKLYERENNRLKSITTATALHYGDFKWFATNGIVRNFHDTSGQPFLEFDTLIIDDIEEVPKDLEKKIGKPEDMGIDELRAYISLMKRTGGPYAREKIDLQLKYSYPMASFIVILLCVPIAANPKRGGIAVSIAVGTLISLLYFVLFRIFQSAGYNEKLPEWLGVWGVNALFFIVGMFSLIKARK